ncbi:MAG: gamma-butyrobetaine hydroxylase-like domain-containing protein [Burkholderiaceae bacterium]
MAGLNKEVPAPTRIVVHQQSRVLEIEFADERIFQLPFELLRVYSPSAEVRGHGPGQETLQTGKRRVGIEAVEPVGNYAIQPHFDDTHNTGIYSWDYLYWLGDQQEDLWQKYLDQLTAAGASREPDGQAPDDSTLDAQSVSRPR